VTVDYKILIRLLVKAVVVAMNRRICVEGSTASPILELLIT